MESFRLLICFAFVVACSIAVQAESPVVPQDAAVAPVPVQEGVPQGPAREKKQALYPYGYSAYPYAYGAYPYYAGAYYPSAYSYSHYDDGKYWPGKYEKAYPYKYGYPYYNSPYYYAY